MKNIITYINESYEVYRLNTLNVKYDCFPEEIIIQAPETYQESDIQQYLDDMLLEGLPANIKYSVIFFGKNSDNIYDSYFEYESFEHLSDDNNEDITFEWDSKYGTNQSNDQKLDYFKIKNMKYCISFDRFDLMDANDDNIQETLEQIFEATESNDNNEYPIEIKLNKDNIEYRK